jgi:hypothetical protein
MSTESTNDNSDDASFESVLSSISKSKEEILRVRNKNLLQGGIISNVNARLVNKLTYSSDFSPRILN